MKEFRFSSRGKQTESETLAAIVKARLEDGCDFPSKENIQKILPDVKSETLYKRLQKLQKIGFIEKDKKSDPYRLKDEFFITTKESAKFVLFFLALKKQNNKVYVNRNELITEIVKSKVIPVSVDTEIGSMIEEAIKVGYFKRHRFRQEQIMSDYLLDNHLEYLKLIAE